jgi:hyperosmotically inducible periplasmic protein
MNIKTITPLLFAAVCVAGCTKSNNSPSANSNPPGQSTTTENAPASTEPTLALDTTTQPSYAPTTEPATQPDNTGINARDNSQDAITAGMQSESQTDIRLIADIRSRVVNQHLSTNADNIKIMSQDGRVTLRGPVNSQQEKDIIGRIAGDAAGGAGNVDNELEVIASGG